MPKFCNNLARNDIVLGIIGAKRVSNADCPFSLKERLTELSGEVGLFSQQYDERRKAVRDILRNGAYKPSGRGKPASEYLVRTLVENQGLPEINPIVDIFNFLSARFQLPISVWDVDKCPSDVFEFDLGGADDSYQFNASGHEIRLADLVVGYASGEKRAPVVSPVKDAHIVKVTEQTEQIAAVVYMPESVVSDNTEDAAALRELAVDLIREASSDSIIDTAVAGFEDEVALHVG